VTVADEDADRLAGGAEADAVARREVAVARELVPGLQRSLRDLGPQLVCDLRRQADTR